MSEQHIKKAVIVGGSNGIGLGIAQELIRKGYHIIVLDKDAPDPNVYTTPRTFTYIKSDLLSFDPGLYEQLSCDPEIEVLMITAGIGRVADFEYLHTAEIEKILKINTISGIDIIRCFYKKIKSQKKFYCGMMGSIAGLVSSPMFSVYAASKAGICRFIESINIELEVAGCRNRILNVSPGSIKGSKFNGGENQPELLAGLSKEIVNHLFALDELYIPSYDEIYKDVLKRYQTDSHAFGISSYQYKKNSGRVQNISLVKIGYLSGTFDLFHVGHLNLLKRAKEHCDYLVVGVHPDASHKGKETFIPFDERKQIVASCRYVDKVIDACAEDSDAWSILHYNKLFVGSDYKGTERFQRYEEYFKDKMVDIIYFPYTQQTSSSQIRNLIIQKSN